MIAKNYDVYLLKNMSVFSVELLKDIVTVGLLDATCINHNFPI